MDALPPDPYAALGVAKDATPAAIKAQYRKLVLRLHPDKVQDESLKQEASDKFHRVQTAYEIVGDEDRRQRYDAQCRLAELKRDIEREGGISRGYGNMRSSGPRAPADFSRGWDSYRSGHVSPNYEERRPPYADYFDTPRERSRKDDSYDRPSKRSSPRDTPKKSRASDKKSKESERSSREERTKRMDQDVRREREKKFAHVSADDLASESDEYERIPRRQSEGDARRQRAPAEDARRRQDEDTERTPKYYTQASDARDYIARVGVTVPEPNIMERRPSPTRKSSSREHIETIRREGKPPISIRRGSGRPAPTSRDSQRKASSREKDIEIVDEPDESSSRRPPMLNKTMSSPENIRPPFERRRSNSVQEEIRDAPLPSVKPPSMRRAETMPYPATNSDSRRKESSKSRRDGRNTYPTPEATPEPPTARKFSYGNAYIVDEPEPVSPQSPAYQTVYREPPTREPTSRQRFTRSPSPVRDSRERSRGATAKYGTPPPPPPSNKRMPSSTYVFPTETTESYSRPAVSRENSGRLFGEIPTSRSSRKYSPPADEIRYSPKPRAEDIRSSSGYKVRRPSEKPYSRNGTPISVR